jgi:hypothetical protein
MNEVEAVTVRWPDDEASPLHECRKEFTMTVAARWRSFSRRSPTPIFPADHRSRRDADRQHGCQRALGSGIVSSQIIRALARERWDARKPRLV